MANVGRARSKARAEEHEEQEEDDQPQFMQQLNTVVKHNQSTSKLDANSHQDGQTSGLQISRIDKQSSFGAGHPYYTQGNSVVVVSSRQEGGPSNAESANLLLLQNQIRDVSSAQFIENEGFEVGSTNRNEEQQEPPQPEGANQSKENDVEADELEGHPSGEGELEEMAEQSQTTTFRERKKQEKLEELKSQFDMQLNNFKRRKEDLLSFDKLQERPEKPEDLKDLKSQLKNEIQKQNNRQSSKQLLATEEANLTFTSESDVEQLEVQVEPPQQEVVSPSAGTAKSETQALELQEIVEPKPQHIHAVPEEEGAPKDKSLSAIKNQLDLTMS